MVQCYTTYALICDFVAVLFATCYVLHASTFFLAAYSPFDYYSTTV